MDSQGEEKPGDLVGPPGEPGRDEAPDEGASLVALGEGDLRDASCRICHGLLQGFCVS